MYIKLLENKKSASLLEMGSSLDFKVLFVASRTGGKPVKTDRKVAHTAILGKP